MINLIGSCNYCGKVWEMTFYSMSYTSNISCPDCGEKKHIKVTKKQKTNAFGYEEDGDTKRPDAYIKGVDDNDDGDTW